MTDLNVNASAGVDLSTPFCAHAYYAGIRAKGCNPVVYKGGLHVLLKGASTDSLNTWAARHDLDGSLRLDHARTAWAKRTSDDELILLGAAPELASSGMV
ncbi:hypothetical protein [Bradyrhizobium sp. S3.5.5]|uniref:hypothetical protein n=1 Tax=Bradyrhizobium sp. S3.5.5 TaxID=3156430 RepID=UPI0033920596